MSSINVESFHNELKRSNKWNHFQVWRRVAWLIHLLFSILDLVLLGSDCWRVFTAGRQAASSLDLSGGRRASSSGGALFHWSTAPSTLKD
jgi:hypothetical protein